MMESEETLVQNAQRGDRAAFEELVRRTSRLVLARLFLDTGDRHLAEDLLQDTLLTAFRSLQQLTEPARFRSWLLRIAHNAAIDSARRGQRLKRQPPADPGRLGLGPTASPDPAEQAEIEEQRVKVLDILRSLPEEYRIPLSLRYLTGADYETIQMQMGLSNGSLRGLLHRGMNLLRAEMEKMPGVRSSASGIKKPRTDS
jgi:RNA polymerase sigma-70 factor (ECF subfamily)